MRVRLALALFGVVAALFAFGRPAPTLAASVSNGGFETGTFAGWTVFNQAGSFPGSNWFVYTGTVGPASGFAIPFPPQGVFAATSDQNGPSTSILYRDIALEPNMPHTISFFYYYNNHNVTFCTPATLDFTALPCNQQNRVDLVSPGASLLSVSPADLLMPLFRSQMGGIPGPQPGVLLPYRLTFDISALAGQTVRLRVASVQSTFFQEVGIDAVSVDGSTTFGTGGVAGPVPASRSGSAPHWGP